MERHVVDAVCAAGDRAVSASTSTTRRESLPDDDWRAALAAAIASKARQRLTYQIEQRGKEIERRLAPSPPEPEHERPDLETLIA